MKRNQDMNEDKILHRLRKADPAKTQSAELISETTIERAIVRASNKSDQQGKGLFGQATANLRQNLLLGAAASGLLVTALVSNSLLGAGVSNQNLITLGQQPSTQSTVEGARDSVSGYYGSEKLMMPNPFSYEYVAGAGLSNEEGVGHVYKIALTGDPQNILKSVAKLFNISGSVKENREQYEGQEEYVWYSVGSDDYTSKNASITWSGTGNWWYSDPAAYPEQKCLDYETGDDGEKWCSAYEEQKATPNLLPSKSEIISQALKIFSATGLNVSANDLTIYSDEWGASASASLKINGQDTPIEWSVGWGSNGKLSYASGNSVKLVDQGEFKTISAKASVSRMGDWRYSGAVASSIWEKYQAPVVAYDGLARDADIAVGEPNSTDGDSTVGGETTPAETTEPTPEVVTIKVNKAHSVLMMIWDSNGDAWLVPGYVLIGSEGWITPVFALEDGVVAIPEDSESGVVY